MKTYKLFFIGFVVTLFLISSCTNQPKEDIESKQMCQGAGYEWMLMKPTQDGKIIKEAESCWGCMVEGVEHVCDMTQFKGFIQLK